MDRDIMDHEHDDHGDSDHDGKDSHIVSAALAGFLFGNIDEKGELEGDFLDEVGHVISGTSDKNILFTS